MAKKYKVIYADPPWRQKGGTKIGGYRVVDRVQIWNVLSNKSEDLPYPTMELQEIKDLPIKDFADKDCALFIWATNAYLPHVFEVIKSWGFTYSTSLVWAKNMMGGGLGGTFRVNTEFLIFAKKGNPKIKQGTAGTWFNVKRTYENGYPKHSKKPDFFYELIEKTIDGPYLELFARANRNDWDAYGNECENSIKIAV